MESFLNDSSHLIQKMSDTIDDFKNFFKPNKAKTKFLISSLVNESMVLMDDALQNSAIVANYSKKDDFILETYKNELMQVMVNLLSNSIDAIKANGIEKGYIEITTKQEGNSCIISIQDNGGGMDSQIIDRVFEPYFTTKFQDEGTGLGLYMSKMIIDNSIRGMLSLKNHQEGVLATITIEQIP
ncbi:MAG: HAMP domain-containing sensor histidine kinase, partial [Campylobacterota bacterium]|nr:HAMP domain-containing sensor histidine kinase [Campylobacterota bacterium]